MAHFRYCDLELPVRLHITIEMIELNKKLENRYIKFNLNEFDFIITSDRSEYQTVPIKENEPISDIVERLKKRPLSPRKFIYLQIVSPVITGNLELTKREKKIVNLSYKSTYNMSTFKKKYTLIFATKPKNIYSSFIMTIKNFDLPLAEVIIYKVFDNFFDSGISN